MKHNMSVEKFTDAEKCLIYGDTNSNFYNEIIVSGINYYGVHYFHQNGFVVYLKFFFQI